MKQRTRDRSSFVLLSLALSALLLAGACGNRAPRLPAAAGIAVQTPSAGTSEATVGGSATAPVDATASASAPAASTGDTGSGNSPSAGGAAAAVKPAAGAAATPKAGTGSTKTVGGGSQTPAGSSATGGGSTQTGGASGGQTTATAQPSGELPGSVKVDGPDSQGVSDTAIRIGVLAPISGAAGFLGENQVDATRASLELVNSRGGVKGRKYQMVVVDTQFEPSVEASGMRRLVEQDKVFAVISVLGDSSAPYVTSKGIPSLSFGVVSAPYSSKYPTTYPLSLHVVEAVAEMAYQLTQVMKLPIKSTAVLYDTQNIPIQKLVKYMVKAWEIWGVEVKSTDKFNLSDADCTQLVIKMRDLAIDFWQIAQSLGWPICQQAMARQNYTPPQGRGGPYSGDENFVAQAGLASAGVYAQHAGVQILKNTGQPYPYHATGRAPAVDDYIFSMKKFSPTGADIASMETIWSQTFWQGGKLIDDAIRHQSGAITWKGVNQWIQSQTAWSGGLTPPHGFVPTCKTGSPTWLFQWKNEGGKLVESDWQPYGGAIKLPASAKEKIAGGGECYLTRIADAEL